MTIKSLGTNPLVWLLPQKLFQYLCISPKNYYAQKKKKKLNQMIQTKKHTKSDQNAQK